MKKRKRNGRVWCWWAMTIAKRKRVSSFFDTPRPVLEIEKFVSVIAKGETKERGKNVADGAWSSGKRVRLTSGEAGHWTLIWTLNMNALLKPTPSLSLFTVHKASFLSPLNGVHKHLGQAKWWFHFCRGHPFNLSLSWQFRSLHF